MTAPPDYGEALRLALAGIEPITETEPAELAAAAGRVLAEPIHADRDQPPFDRAQMDGYALRAAEIGRVEAFPVAATIPAGAAPDVAVPPGACVAIATGAALPPGVDAVIPHEQSDLGDPVRFPGLQGPVEPGHAVHPRGADARAGDTLVRGGTLLAARHLGIAAATGLTTLTVVRRPRATLLTSGDEVMPQGAAVLAHQIRNGNAPMVTGLLWAIGAEPLGHRHLADEPDVTEAAVRDALAAGDLVVTVGGISAGRRDHFPGAFERNGVELSLRQASIQPGRPVLVGRAAGGRVVLALPGNPVSALACACLFGWPIVRVMLGLSTQLPWRPVDLAEPVKANANRRAFRPAVLTGPATVTVPRWAGSGDLAHTAPTHGLVELPVQDGPVAAGTRLRFLPWP